MPFSVFVAKMAFACLDSLAEQGMLQFVIATLTVFYVFVFVVYVVPLVEVFTYFCSIKVSFLVRFGAAKKITPRQKRFCRSTAIFTNESPK